MSRLEDPHFLRQACHAVISHAVQQHEDLTVVGGEVLEEVVAHPAVLLSSPLGDG